MEQAISFNINHILSELMFEKKIKMIDLAQQTGVPQSTLSRILSGDTTNPHRSSLEPIASFFQITIDQLKGLEPISFLNRVRYSALTAMTVPLLSWEQITNWVISPSNFTVNERINIDIELGDESGFAVTVDDTAMEPQFPRGTLLIVDSKKAPKDRSFVIISLGEHNKIIFRQLLTDGINQYLRPLSPDFSQFKMVAMSPSDKVLGVVIQARQNYPG